LSAVVPFDLDAATAFPEWREGFSWPAPHPEVAAISMAVVERYLNLLNEIDDPFQRQVAIAASALLIPRAQVVMEAAYLLFRARNGPSSLAGGPEEIEALRGEKTVDQLSSRLSVFDKGLTPIKLAGLRRIKIAARWNRWRLPAAVLWPKATALSVSPLLVKAASLPGARVDFKHPATILRDALERRPPASANDDVSSLQEVVSAGLSAEPALSTSDIGGVVRDLMRRESKILRTIATHVAALRNTPGVPRRVWSGSAGNYLNRLVGLEAMRRGGTAMRYSHAGLFDLQYQNPQETAAVELAASTHLVVPSRIFAETLQNNGGIELVAKYNRPKIIQIDGDPVIGSLGDRQLMRRKKTERAPRVLYVMAMMMGFRQVPTPTAPPDIVYLDWQRRLLDRLASAPIDLLCKPHPEGIRPGGAHPLVKHANYSDERFEAMMDWADIFLFDMFGSTTFYIAACTGRKMVVINLVPEPLAPRFDDIYRRRCTWIDVHYDERSLPRFDGSEVAAAVSDVGPPADPTEFRQMYGIAA
jgi:hypothetical protein